jgi:cytosine/adenosine deaminase-related metal-dependent hydrolase
MLQRSLAIFLLLIGCQRSGERRGPELADMAVGPTGPTGPTGSTGPSGPTFTECQSLPPLATGTCEVTSGGAQKLLEGTVLTPGQMLHGGQVLVDGNGNITCVACDCSGQAQNPTKISCPSGVISPGLINTHDHLDFTQNSPGTDSGERYEQRHDWRKGERGHTKISVSGSATADQIAWGELRFLMGGATSVVGVGSAKGLVRNLDKSADEMGLNHPAVDFSTFPLGDSTGTQISVGCAYKFSDTTTSIASDKSYEPHIAEGIDSVAHNEFLCASSSMNGGQDLVQPQSAFIHSVGLQPSDYALMAANSTALIWSPRSNIRLYGHTALVTVAQRMGVLISLGTDWTPSGSMNLLRELHCADQLNQTYYDHFFSDEDLWLMATYNGAVATASDDALGLLAPGHLADISIFNGASHPDHRAVIAADPADVVLVMRAGTVLYGDANIVSGLGVASCDAVDVCGTSKSLCLMSEVGKTYDALKTSAASYAAFFCGTPDNEPTCVPSRPAAVNNSSVYTGVASAGDMDGDGVPDAMDNCPRVFNPIRPLDGGKQGDFDSDGVGDLCDVCPLDANKQTCSMVDPNDSDGDGIPNTMDNCPQTPNPDQADRDMDGHGDVCDGCPDTPNPGTAGCGATVYDIKSGKVAVGTTVTVKHLLVTGVAKSGFFAQLKPGDSGYSGADNSGIWSHQSSTTATVGSRVTITGTVSNYFNEIELDSISFTVDSAGPEAAPDAVDVAPGDVATGSSRAAALEGVVVRVQGVQVTNNMPALGAGDKAPSNEFVVNTSSTGGVRVDDFLFLVSPTPALGTTYSSLSGVLMLKNGDSKIQVRGASDVVP